MEQSMSRVGHCIDNGPTEGFWGIIKSEMYQLYDITDEVRTNALDADVPAQYPIPENKRIMKYKVKWCA